MTDILTLTRRPGNVPPRVQYNPVAQAFGSLTTFLNQNARPVPSPQLASPTTVRSSATGGGGAAVGALYYTRDELIEKYNRIDANITGLYNDMRAEITKNYGGNPALLPSDLKALFLDYRTFGAQWTEFRDDLGDVLASTAGQWAEMDNRYNIYLAYRKRWEDLGQTVSNPLLPPDATTTTNKSLFNIDLGKSGIPWTPILVLAGGLVALLVLREVRPERALVTERVSSPRAPAREAIESAPVTPPLPPPATRPSRAERDASRRTRASSRSSDALSASSGTRSVRTRRSGSDFDEASVPSYPRAPAKTAIVKSPRATTLVPISSTRTTTRRESDRGSDRTVLDEDRTLSGQRLRTRMTGT